MRATALVLPLLLLAGCASPSASGPQFAHVHGLASSDGSLFVATHNGLVRGDSKDGSWTWSYVGEKRYDLMGFSQDGADASVFYAGGHPGLLGLAKSGDGGVTWTSQSLEGKADIHALTGLPGKAGAMVAWWTGTLASSTDGGRTWTSLATPPGPVLALAASDSALYAGTGTGLLVSRDGGKTLNPATSPAPGTVAALAASRDGKLLLASIADATDTVQAFRSMDGGTTWKPLDSNGLKDAPYSVVFAIDPKESSHAFAATYTGHVEESRDAGATWNAIRT